MNQLIAKKAIISTPIQHGLARMKQIYADLVVIENEINCFLSIK